MHENHLEDFQFYTIFLHFYHIEDNDFLFHYLLMIVNQDLILYTYLYQNHMALINYIYYMIQN